MLLFDDSKKLEKALGEEAAAVIVHAFEKADEKNRQDLATKADLRELELRLEYRLTVRFGTMLTAAVAILAALMVFLK